MPINPVIHILVERCYYYRDRVNFLGHHFTGYGVCLHTRHIRSRWSTGEGVVRRNAVNLNERQRRRRTLARGKRASVLGSVLGYLLSSRRYAGCTRRACARARAKHTSVKTHWRTRAHDGSPGGPPIFASSSSRQADRVAAASVPGGGGGDGSDLCTNIYGDTTQYNNAISLVGGWVGGKFPGEREVVVASTRRSWASAPLATPPPPEQLHTSRGTERGLVRALNLDGPAGVVWRVRSQWRYRDPFCTRYFIYTRCALLSSKSRENNNNTHVRSHSLNEAHTTTRSQKCLGASLFFLKKIFFFFVN